MRPDAGWIGVATGQTQRFHAQGLGARPRPDRADAADPCGLMPRGTLTIEFRLSSRDRPQTLLACTRSDPWRGGLSIRAVPGGGFVLVASQGDDLRHVTLPFRPVDRTDILRLSYSWDAPARLGRLALERPDSEAVYAVRMAAPHPVPRSDMQRIVTEQGARQVDQEVIFLAVSDRVEPVGAMPGLAAAVPVATPDGYRPAGDLARGDTVRTIGGQVVPVLQAVRRDVPAFGSFAPVRLRAPYFGLRRDILVAPQQRLVIRGSEVEYLFGHEAVLVPARHLVNGVSALRAPCGLMMRYHHLLLPGHEVLDAAGAPTESFYIGRLRRKPDLLHASVLAGCDSAWLPEHARPAWPVLKPLEAITLTMNRAA